LKRLIPDFLNLRYEYLFKILGNDGNLSYEAKCLFLVAILYTPGLIVTTLTDTVKEFISIGWGFFLSNVLLGIVVWLLISFSRKANDKLVQVTEIIAPTKKESEELKEWKEKIEEYKEWTHFELTKWYWHYFQAITATIGGFLICKFIILERVGIGWIQNNLLNELYFLAWFSFLGFLAGSSLSYVFIGFWLIRKYCKDVISEKEVKPLDPDHTGGLRELGRLSLDLDLVVALPSLTFLIYLPQRPEVLSVEVLGGLSILYCLLLISVFFITLSPAHNAMVKAKIDCLTKIHKEYREMHETLIEKLVTEKRLKKEDYERLKGLYDLYDRTESMAVWPLDYRILLRFLVTSVLPLIASVITISLWP